MKIEDIILCGYYEDDNEDYIVEIDTNKLKEWMQQENLNLLDFETNMERKIDVYKILEEEIAEKLDHYRTFTVKFK